MSLKYRTISITYNELWREKGGNGPASDYTQAWFTEADLIELKEAGVTHIEFYGLWWKHLVDPTTGEPNIDRFKKWVDPFIGYCMKNDMPFSISLAPIRQTNLQHGPFHIPDFVWKDAGYSTGWWLTPNAHGIQAKIIFKFFRSLDPVWENTRQKWFKLLAFIADRYQNAKMRSLKPTIEPIHHTSEYQTEIISKAVGVGYSRTMERAIDAIRVANPSLTVIVDRPYLLSFDHIQPVNRANIVWCAHAYYSYWTQNMDLWKARIKSYIDKFVIEFGRPLYIGEYGHDPSGYYQTLSENEIKTSISEMINYMSSQPITGCSFFTWGRLNQKGWSSFNDTWYNPTESAHILKTVLQKEPPTMKTEINYIVLLLLKFIKDYIDS